MIEDFLNRFRVAHVYLLSKTAEKPQGRGSRLHFSESFTLQKEPKVPKCNYGSRKVFVSLLGVSCFVHRPIFHQNKHLLRVRDAKFNANNLFAKFCVSAELNCEGMPLCVHNQIKFRRPNATELDSANMGGFYESTGMTVWMGSNFRAAGSVKS